MKNKSLITAIGVLIFVLLLPLDGTCMEIGRAPFQSPIRKTNRQMTYSYKKQNIHRRKNPHPRRSLKKDEDLKERICKPYIQRKLFGDDENDPNPSKGCILTVKKHTPEFRISSYDVTSWKSLQTHLLTKNIAMVVDFDGTLARRLYTVTPLHGDPFTIRYAASAEWNSPMYKSIFSDVLSELGKTSYQFDQLFPYFKEFIRYDILDAAFTSLDLSKIGEKIVLSGLKDKDGHKKTLCGPHGFSYHYSAKKSSKIAKLLNVSPDITEIFFIDNNPNNVRDVQTKLPLLWKTTYDTPTVITVNVVHFDYFKEELMAHQNDLQSEIHAMFDYVEKTLGVILSDDAVHINLENSSLAY